MTQVEKEQSCERIEGYVLKVSDLTEANFVKAKNELIANLECAIECAKRTSFADFVYHYKHHSTTIKP